jgi:hypothetical protein
MVLNMMFQTDEALKKQIHFGKRRIANGQTLVIPTNWSKTSNSVQNQVVFHEVLQKKLSIPLLKNTILALMN